MAEQHDERQAAATIVLAPVENPTAYGLVETEEDGRVRRFLEKPKPDEISVNTINAGTYVLEPRLLDLIPANEGHSFEYDLFPTLLERSEAFYAHVPEKTYWIDIGTPARYLQVHHDLLADTVGHVRLIERRGSRVSPTTRRRFSSRPSSRKALPSRERPSWRFFGKQFLKLALRQIVMWPSVGPQATLVVSWLCGMATRYRTGRDG